MDDLHAPDRDTAARIVREVDFEHRLAGGYVHERAGVMMLSLYSVEEVFALLCSACPQIDIGQLERWLRTTIGDSELADRVRDIAAQDESRQDLLSRVRDAIGLRLVQCRQALATESVNALRASCGRCGYPP